MITNCILQNAKKCIHRESIRKCALSSKITIVYGFDWKVNTDNPALMYDFVNKIIKDVSQEHSIQTEFQGLGGKDGSIYCNICEQIQKADIGLFDISTHNLNVIFELGLAISSGLYVYILRSRHHKLPTKLLSDLNGVLEYRFTRTAGNLKFEANLEENLRQKILKIAKKKAKNII